jgi:hypothetical protein
MAQPSAMMHLLRVQPEQQLTARITAPLPQRLPGQPRTTDQLDSPAVLFATRVRVGGDDCDTLKAARDLFNSGRSRDEAPGPHYILSQVVGIDGATYADPEQLADALRKGDVAPYCDGHIALRARFVQALPPTVPQVPPTVLQKKRSPGSSCGGGSGSRGPVSTAGAPVSISAAATNAPSTYEDGSDDDIAVIGSRSSDRTRKRVHNIPLRNLLQRAAPRQPCSGAAKRLCELSAAEKKHMDDLYELALTFPIPPAGDALNRTKFNK